MLENLYFKKIFSLGPKSARHHAITSGFDNCTDLIRETT